MSEPKVYVTRIIPEGGLRLVREACDAEIWEGETPPPRKVLLEKVRGVDGLLSLLTDRIDGELMDAAGPQLKVISNYAVGYNNIDVDAATARGIAVGNTPGVLTDTTADMAFTLLMAAARRVAEGVDYVRAGKWRTWGPTLLLGRDIHHATLGIIGFGRIGRTVAKRAQGFEMEVLFYDPLVDAGDPEAKELGATSVDLDALLARSDFVTVHVPLMDETHHMISTDALNKMKSTAILINTSRGPVVDPDALYQALREGEIAYAALDVTEPEPINMDSPLLSLPNCVIVPHIASASIATRTRMAEIAAHNLIAGLRGESLPAWVNPEVAAR
jgi:lactate dehydrogenase-like 2-hydroxyacid dehydrogenase